MTDHKSMDSLWLALYKLREIFMSHRIESNHVASSVDLASAIRIFVGYVDLDSVSVEIWPAGFHKNNF